MGVSKNSGTPKSSILIGVSIINHPFWDTTTIFGNTQMCLNSMSFGKKAQAQFISIKLSIPFSPPFQKVLLGSELCTKRHWKQCPLSRSVLSAENLRKPCEQCAGIPISVPLPSKPLWLLAERTEGTTKKGINDTLNTLFIAAEQTHLPIFKAVDGFDLWLYAALKSIAVMQSGTMRPD